MSRFIPVALAVLLTGGALSPVLLAHAADPAAKKSSVKSAGVTATSSDNQKVGYSFGYLMGKGNSEAVNDLDIEKFFAGFRDGYGNKPSALTEDEMRKTLMAYKEKRDAEAMKEIQKLGSENAAKGAAFLAENGKKAGVKTTASGLQYEVIKEGTGAQPTADDQVQVHYEGKMLDGTVFDSSIARGQPVTFPLTGVIPGWTEGLQLMKEGAKYRFYIPSKLAYGETGASTIPPNSVLTFDVELIKVIKAGSDKAAAAPADKK
ncbi:FKBP-type peptidyl-prolyl cis-trans isomerase [Aquirhabdus parva]|uniref:Peptidyl-prolyl cis-trans isomerase n=1 Tax=Aquirhabdus parva TaxID=2283318 RepID=A0A345PAL9_9GAMM|nr:FKBP-type peptidyl-prolyl cis-trans isomerase [Aquirhabdus parva]AXI04328.1 FKBP-type peptidyl-prolyl cis-trans isomerase [Aquirhabdus parva]